MDDIDIKAETDALIQAINTGLLIVDQALRDAFDGRFVLICRKGDSISPLISNLPPHEVARTIVSLANALIDGRDISRTPSPVYPPTSVVVPAAGVDKKEGH